MNGRVRRASRGRRTRVPLAAAMAGLLGSCAAAGCGAPDADQAPSAALDLPEGFVAKVGTDLIDARTVARIARAEAATVEVAQRAAVRDALFAAAARDRLPHGLVRAAERGVLARALLEQLRDAARAQGAPNEAEVAAVTAERWMNLDRPRSVRTAHAVVLLKGADRAKAKRVAGKLAQATQGKTEEAAFLKAAQAVDAEGLEIRAEALSPVTADGRVVHLDQEQRARATQEERYDPAYAKAATALRQVGQQSEVVESSFGFHVILMLEELPPLRRSFEERQRLVAPEVHAKRARRAAEELTRALRASNPVEVERNADQLTALAQATR